MTPTNGKWIVLYSARTFFRQLAHLTLVAFLVVACRDASRGAEANPPQATKRTLSVSTAGAGVVYRLVSENEGSIPHHFGVDPDQPGFSCDVLLHAGMFEISGSSWSSVDSATLKCPEMTKFREKQPRSEEGTLARVRDSLVFSDRRGGERWQGAVRGDTLFLDVEGTHRIYLAQHSSK